MVDLCFLLFPMGMKTNKQTNKTDHWEILGKDLFHDSCQAKVENTVDDLGCIPTSVTVCD